KRFMNVLLQSSMDIIVCIRAREKVDMKNPREIKSLGIQPICEKNFMFEMTASVMMHDEGRFQDVIKCPSALKDVMGRGEGYLGIEDGVKLREWIDGGSPVDSKVEHYRATLANACEGGLASLQEAWNALPKEMKHLLTDEKNVFKESAEGYDRQK